MAYSLDFRQKVLKVRAIEGLSIADVAARFDIGIATVVRWLKRIEAKPHGFRRRKVDIEQLAQDIRDYTDAYQYERAARFGVHQNAICHGLKKLGVSYKKNTSAPKSERRRTTCLSRKDVGV
jgi:transposase